MPSPVLIDGPDQLAPQRMAGVRLSGARLSPANESGRAPADATGLSFRGACTIKERQKSWSAVSATMAEMRCEGHLQVDFGADGARLSAVIEEVGGRFEVHAKNWQVHGTPHEASRPLSVIPAGLRAHGRGDNMRFMRHLLLQFDLLSLARMTEDEIDLADAFTPRPTFSDPGIMRLAQLFADECSGDDPHPRLYGDNLSIALLLALARLGSLQASPARSGSLAPWQLRRATEYLAAHLADDVELQTLAKVVNLSSSHFSRAFKTSTGLAPHQWLVHARIAKAKELLMKSDRSLAQIAIDVGFADQAHFTRMFGRAVGESPGAWQRTRGA
jgi:AraC family transcriptional regulator